MSSPTEIKPDRRPAIIICTYDPHESGWDPVEDLSGNPWSPPGARTVAVRNADPERLAATLNAHVQDADCRAILLVGRTSRSAHFRVQMRAANRALAGDDKASPTGPSTARATAPVAEIVRALQAAGLAADATSDGEEDVGSFLLYNILSNLPDGIDAPAVGLLRAPAAAQASAVQRGVKTAAGVIARNLSPLPRTRAS